MRLGKALCLTLAALNVLALSARLVPKGDDELRYRASQSAGASRTELPSGGAVPFRPGGEKPEPAPNPLAQPVPAAPHVEERIDESAYSYLGSMKSPEGKTVYFFKNRAANRVDSAGYKDGGIKVLFASEKEFLLEIDGKKYKVVR